MDGPKTHKLRSGVHASLQLPCRRRNAFACCLHVSSLDVPAASWSLVSFRRNAPQAEHPLRENSTPMSDSAVHKKPSSPPLLPNMELEPHIKLDSTSSQLSRGTRGPLTGSAATFSDRYYYLLLLLAGWEGKSSGGPCEHEGGGSGPLAFLWFWLKFIMRSRYSCVAGCRNGFRGGPCALRGLHVHWLHLRNWTGFHRERVTIHVHKPDPPKSSTDARPTTYTYTDDDVPIDKPTTKPSITQV